MARAENQVETYLHDQIVKLGGTTYKWTSSNRVSVPDRIVILKGAVWFVEVKTLGKHPTPAQQREMNRLKSHGCNVTYVSGKAGVDEFIKGIK